MVLNQIVSIVRSSYGETYRSEKNIVKEICRYVINNLELDCSIDSIAREFHFSTHYIRHIFKKQTGTSLKEFKTSQIIKKAKLLLRTSNYKIIDIAAACGFESHSYFTEIFTKEAGISPKDYRNKYCVLY